MRWVSELRWSVLLLAAASAARAQDELPGPYVRAVQTWIGLPANPGYERAATERIVNAQAGWVRDGMGNLIKRAGEGQPRRVIACGLDAEGFAVSEVTDDGYLRVHAAGNGARVALWEQFHEGQRVFVASPDRANPARTRNTPGVFATRSNHLWRRRTADDAPTSIENLWIDIGARSRAEVERMGVRVLDPVFREWPEWSFGEWVAGPGASERAGCAAVAAAAGSPKPVSGENIYVISVMRSFNWAGLTGVLARLSIVDTLVLVSSDVVHPVGQLTNRVMPAPWPAHPGVFVKTLIAIGAPSRYTGTLVESLNEDQIEALHHAVASASGLGNVTPRPVLLADAWSASPASLKVDSLSTYGNLLARLTDIYALSGFEGPMRDAIQRAMPAWALEATKMDSSGNLIVSAGPDRDTTVVVAHMDEIGFNVTRIARDGTLSLRARGTFYPFLWEGQPALLHRPDDQIASRSGPLGCGAARGGPLRGVFIPRDSSAQRQPPTMTAWFGLDSAALVAAGVTVGSPITSYKCATRIGDTRITARSIDDRAGVTALLMALDSISPAALDHKVIFAFSVREEGGLEGAKALAEGFGPSVRRVHAVDTFVSSDSPMESRRFGYAPIGQGAVVRALDNSSVAPADEVERVLRIARAGGIPLQAGVTNGGNDGSELVRFGAVNVALAWPLRYSHSPAEVMDLRDLRALARIVAAVAKAPATTRR